VDLQTGKEQSGQAQFVVEKGEGKDNVVTEKLRIKKE